VVEGNQEVGTGSLVFNEDGTLQSIDKTDPTISVDFAGATAGQAIDLGLGTPTTDGGMGLDGVTQFASLKNTSSITQDGYPAGALSGISIGSDGTVEGLYTNGEKSPIGQLAIAKFRANEALARGGSNLWVETPDSGSAVLGAAGSGGRGSLTSGALETSNIDLGEEMVEMIRFQRAYSASSKTIQAADELLSSLLMMKR
jgi:flagellar hook protein FlgE